MLIWGTTDSMYGWCGMASVWDGSPSDALVPLADERQPDKMHHRMPLHKVKNESPCQNNSYWIGANVLGSTWESEKDLPLSRTGAHCCDRQGLSATCNDCVWCVSTENVGGTAPSRISIPHLVTFTSLDLRKKFERATESTWRWTSWMQWTNGSRSNLQPFTRAVTSALPSNGMHIWMCALMSKITWCILHPYIMLYLDLPCLLVYSESSLYA